MEEQTEKMFHVKHKVKQWYFVNIREEAGGISGKALQKPVTGSLFAY